MVGMHGEIATQNYCNTKEEFIDYFTHDSWFLDLIERRHPLAFMLYSLKYRGRPTAVREFWMS
jgi:hypothetical protein